MMPIHPSFLPVLLLPLLASSYALYVRCRHGRRHPFALWALILTPLLSVAILFGASKLGQAAKTADIEYWGSALQSAVYEEPWDEEVPCVHTKYCTREVTKTRSGANGQTETYTDEESYACGTEHPYDVDYHPATWTAADSQDASYSISPDRFEWLCQRFGVRQFVNMNRSYHSINGNAYATAWPGGFETLVPIVTTHHYENRVAVSDSVFHYPEVSPETKQRYGLLDYPGVDGNWECPSVLVSGALEGGNALQQADDLLRRHNARLGPVKQVRMWLVVFVNQPLDAAVNQESYWQGGNKNEAVLCVGVNSKGLLQWAYPFGWSKKEQLEVDLRNAAQKYRDKPVDWVALVGDFAAVTQRDFQRRHFKEFNYITVPLPWWAVVAGYLLTVVISVAGAVASALRP